MAGHRVPPSGHGHTATERVIPWAGHTRTEGTAGGSPGTSTSSSPDPERQRDGGLASHGPRLGPLHGCGGEERAARSPDDPAVCTATRRAHGADFGVHRLPFGGEIRGSGGARAPGFLPASRSSTLHTPAAWRCRNLLGPTARVEETLSHAAASSLTRMCERKSSDDRKQKSRALCRSHAPRAQAATWGRTQIARLPPTRGLCCGVLTRSPCPSMLPPARCLEQGPAQ